jgi:hypothetical protein
MKQQPFDKLSGTEPFKDVTEPTFKVAVSEIVADVFNHTLKQDFLSKSGARPDYEQNPESRELMFSVDRDDLISMVLGVLRHVQRGELTYTEDQLKQMTNRALFSLYMDRKLLYIRRKSNKIITKTP